ncbi:MAG: hypothetical protein HYV37_02655 [Candidatus Levyibacteriota bacterium]|nr:MAG: hypothetical protein HYV37_02655 [Candidatus Levybacteria bacterium]
MRKKSTVFMAIVIASVVVFSIGQVAVANSLSTTGITLSKIEKEINAYSLENSLLKEKLLVKESLQYIASEAATIGFAEVKSQIIIGSSLPIAIKP